MNALIPSDTAIICRGRNAWKQIKATAAEQRQLWREVGEALCVGKRENPSNKAFSDWCKTHGFDMDARVRSEAIWFASSNAWKMDIPADMAHPTAIHQWVNAQAPAPSPDLELEPAKPAVNLADVAKQARKINALVNSAERGDETAKRHLDKKAKEFGGTVEEVVRTARAVAPELVVSAGELPILEANQKKVHEMAEYFCQFLINTQQTDGSVPLTLDYALLEMQRAYARLTANL